MAGNAAPARREAVRIEAAYYGAVRKRGGRGDFTKDDIALLFVRQRGRCAVCRQKIGLEAMHRDHIEPIKAGGKNELANIQLLCRQCNCSKGARDPLQFMQSRGFLL